MGRFEFQLVPDFCMNSARQVVCIASTMRSGSTLLKALLAEANDISNLPEQNFQKYHRDPQAATKILALDDSRIVALKRPAWYNEIRRYPALPQVDGLKTILLVRDVYDTVESLRKMSFRKLAPLMKRLADSWMARRYWLGITRSLLQLNVDLSAETALVRYEDLTTNPIEETQRLFQFVGSTQSDGVDTYSPPDDFRWRWGSDDNSDNIKSLKVQARAARPATNKRLLELIDNHPDIQMVRQQLGYAD